MDKTFDLPGSNEPMSELLGELTDALEILYSCRRLEVPIGDNFLTYVDQLIDRLEAGRGYASPANSDAAYWTASLVAEA